MKRQLSVNVDNLLLLDKRIVEVLFDNYETISIQVKGKQSKALDFYEKRFLSIVDEVEHKNF